MESPSAAASRCVSFESRSGGSCFLREPMAARHWVRARARVRARVRVRVRNRVRVRVRVRIIAWATLVSVLRDEPTEQ